MSIFSPILAGASLRGRLFACAGALAGLLLAGVLTGWLAGPYGVAPLLVGPTGAAAVLIFCVPASPLAQPWPVLGGNVISALVGVAVAQVLGATAPAAALAVALAIAAMSLTRSLHPPGGAAAVTGVLGGPAIAKLGWLFPFAPLGLDVIALIAAGWLFHRLSGHSYPHRPAVVAQPVATLRRGDIDAALAELGENFDIARADLDSLLTLAERHAAARRR